MASSQVLVLTESWRTEPASTTFSSRHAHLAFLLRCWSCPVLSLPPKAPLAGLLFSSPTLDSQCQGPDNLGNAVAEVSMWNRVCGHSSCDAPEIIKPHKTGFGPMVRLTKMITILLSPSEWQFECGLWIRGLVDSGGCGLELSVLTDCVLRILIFL